MQETHVSRVFRAEQALMLESYRRLTAEIRNPGDRGVARELLLSEFICPSA